MTKKEYKILEKMTEGECEDLDNAILDAHEAEAKKRKLKFYNLGWGQTDTGICSKTSGGYLETEMNLVTKKITHTLERY